MSKKNLLLSLAGIILLTSFLKQEEVSVTMKAPASVKPGGDFLVEITINKGTTTGFGQIKQELPDGFKAEAKVKNGGEFKMSGQTLRFTWTELPAENQFKATYRVTLDPKVKGKQTIGGKFSSAKEL